MLRLSVIAHDRSLKSVLKGFVKLFAGKLTRVDMAYRGPDRHMVIGLPFANWCLTPWFTVLRHSVGVLLSAQKEVNLCLRISCLTCIGRFGVPGVEQGHAVVLQIPWSGDGSLASTIALPM